MTPMRPVNIPADLADRLEQRAKSMGLSVPAYIRLSELARDGKLSEEFQAALASVFTRFPKTMKRLGDAV